MLLEEKILLYQKYRLTNLKFEQINLEKIKTNMFVNE